MTCREVASHLAGQNAIATGAQFSPAKARGGTEMAHLYHETSMCSGAEVRCYSSTPHGHATLLQVRNATCKWSHNSQIPILCHILIVATSMA